MKRLLLLSIWASFIYVGKAQVPQNDLIENATLITESFYEEFNLRLDLATATPGATPGCNVETFPRVYYKFTAQSNSTVQINLLDQFFNTIAANSSFAIIYTASDLNATNDNQFTGIASACQFGTSAFINTTQGQSYYILVNRSEANSTSRIQITMPQSVPVAERDALIDLYNATNGNAWTTNTNWNSTTPESEWHGITVNNGHVTEIDLSFNNLDGNISTSVTDLSFLESLSFRNNSISGTLPDLSTVPSLQNVDIQFNDFSFADLETHFSTNTTITQFLYETQNNIDNESIIDATLGSDYNLTTSTVNGTSVSYQWYRLREDVSGDDEIIVGANSNVYSITNAQSNDIDSYICYITSPSIPDLLLKRNPIKLRTPVSQEERDALIALYNATDGDNWTNNTNWLSVLPVGEWHGVTTTGNKVTGIQLNFQNLNGQLPSEIGDLIHLKELRISGNDNLTGSIPATIGNLTELLWLRFQFTGLSGLIPSDIGDLISLERLWLRGNSFNSNLPSTLTNLNNLESLDIDSNNFSSDVPDLTNLPNLQWISLSNNAYQFGDFEDEFNTYQTNLDFIEYVPQAQLSDDETILVSLGDSQTLEAVVSGINNQYQWYLNNSPIAGATNASLVLNNLQNSDFGAYKCEVTNTIITDLTLETGTTTINQDPTTHPDYDALVAFYNATNGDNWTNNTNWLDTTKPVSTWYGVTEVNGRVGLLSLFNNNLNGTIPVEIGDFSELTFLQIANNPFLFGTIPNEITNLSNLQTLALYSCGLSGELPTDIGNLTNLTYIGLFNNFFSGDLPASVADLVNLQFIEINNNDFTGSLANLQSGFANLQVFNIANNNFEGTLPDFTPLPNLQTLWIQNNKFEFGDFENQHASYVGNTNLNYSFSPQKFLEAPENIAIAPLQSGTINSNISGSQNTYFWIKGNSGQGGSVVSNDQDLNLTINSTADYGSYYLEISSALVPGLLLTTNNFEVSDLPSNNPDYDALVAFYNSTNGNNWNFNDNWLDNTKPLNTWTGVTINETTNRVEELSFGFNNITGTIPPEIGDLTELKVFSVQNNILSGTIPEEFWNLQNLEQMFFNISPFAIDANTITLDFTPTSNPTFANMPNLFRIFISNIDIPQQAINEISALNNVNTVLCTSCNIGPDLPSAWATIPNLQLSSNELEGTIPMEYQTSSTLNFLDISNNFYDFSDLEPLTNNNNINTFTYSPQRTTDVEQSVESEPGNDITLTVTDDDINRQDGRSATSNTFQWFKDDVAINGATADSYTIFNAQPSDSGIYYCEITNTMLPDLTIRRANITVDVGNTLSIDNNDIEVVTIYPNPVKTWLNIKRNTSGNGLFTIYDLNGRLVLKQVSTSNLTSLNIETLQPGAYILEITDGNKRTKKRFIKN